MTHRLVGIVSVLIVGFACAAMAASIPRPASNTGESSLAGTRWRLVATDGTTSWHEPFAGFTLKATRRFAEGSSGILVDASDGCNWFDGTYFQHARELRIRVRTRTLLSCLSARVQKSNDSASSPTRRYARPFTVALDEVTQFSLRGETLNLLDENGDLLLRFTATTDN